MRGDQFSRVIRLAHLLMVKPAGITVKQIAKKHKGKAKDVIDFPSYNYAQAARSHVKMFIIDTHGIDISSPLICPDWAKWWMSYQASRNAFKLDLE